ncbi:hypothetical protein KPH14_000972 [Odynerus spinipes]|uniref:Uncharacterized protein n=1 Tax=Odynerus spinipes TaxID=1348599 RepID=A0AAD9RFE7_9HYME|nr:hypothetical protein KPH14_000972 [Odynerus spinipes]
MPCNGETEMCTVRGAKGASSSSTSRAARATPTPPPPFSPSAQLARSPPTAPIPRSVSELAPNRGECSYAEKASSPPRPTAFKSPVQDALDDIRGMVRTCVEAISEFREEQLAHRQDTAAIGSSLERISAELAAISTPLTGVDGTARNLRADLSTLSAKQEKDTSTLHARVAALEKKPIVSTSPSGSFNDGVSFELARLRGRLARLETSSHTTEVVLSGVPEEPEENVKKTVVKVAAALGLTTTEEELTSARRLPSSGSGGTRPRTILARFNASTQRDAILAAKKWKRTLLASEINLACNAHRLFATVLRLLSRRDVLRSSYVTSLLFTARLRFGVTLDGST